MIIDIISPYHGGSHRAWATGYQRWSAHEIRPFTLPDRFWKWRMHGGAVTLSRRWLARLQAGMPSPDLLLFTDMCDLTTFMALTRTVSAAIPTALYMHENQLTYPLPADGRTGPMRRQHGERDLHYAFINWASMLAADRVFFNSQYHMDAYFDALPGFLNHFPEYKEQNSKDLIRRKSVLLPVGVDFQTLTPVVEENLSLAEPPLIIWNQRWEYDKNPTAFFEALFTIAAEGIPFRLALCGQRYGRQPAVFTQALARLKEHVFHVGYAGNDQYGRLLHAAEITVSTAVHEFFGISILEAIYSRAFPILPRRLSYPELLPEAYHDLCMYRDSAGLLNRLRWALANRQEAQVAAGKLATAAAEYDWRTIASVYDQEMLRLRKWYSDF